ncbi:hypothetical protein ASTA108788_12470 [Asticcacaulis taihuensis]|uniref:Uncharacterized protein n=1 Tax=Asticcacaulis taihuensis TaxID=260084 RepID=A0A1G4SR24_9CAUL|nr:hypothetical protein SAMN02927928_2797 [Asticcacaulis taihuensis]
MVDMKAPSVSDTSPEGLRADTSPASQGRIVYLLPSSVACGGGIAAKSATEEALKL